MRTPATRSFTVNGRTYAPPARPVAVICFDGCGDEYLDAAMAQRRMPHLEAMAMRGYRGMARGALPSFTNTNNASIVTGAPPSVHGITGNFFLDPATREEVMMNSPRYLRAGTIPAAAAAAGRRVAVVTAKDKLREILAHDLDGISLSAEKAAEARRETHGIDHAETLVGEPSPPIYSAEASLFVLRAGLALLAEGLADFLYLSLTDYVQHRHPPRAPEAIDFCARVDLEVGRLLERGSVVGLTADHGMNAKETSSGTPNVIYLEDILRREIGPGVRVILPITDPYVRHHGALGSFAELHLDDSRRLEDARVLVESLPGIVEVHDRSSAARRLELPADRTGDLVILSGRDVVIGKSPAHHDLSGLGGGLRSHGGRYEEMVPLLVSAPLKPAYEKRACGDPRNFDIFDFTLNGVEG